MPRVIKKLAEAFHCPGVPVDNADDFRFAMTDALKHKGPTIIMVMEDDNWLTSN